MKKNIVKDVLFLGQKSEEATPEDRTLALDLQDTLNAHLLECVGLAANMIGVKKRAIIIRMGSENLVLFNPVLLEKKKPYQTEEGCLSLVGSRPTTRYEEISVAYRDVNWKSKKDSFVRFSSSDLSARNGSSRRHYYLKMKDGVDSAPFF